MAAWGHRYFSVKEAYEEGLIDKLVPGYSLNRCGCACRWRRALGASPRHTTCVIAVLALISRARVPALSLDRFRKLKKDLLGDQEPVYNDTNKPRFKFKREDANA